MGLPCANAPASRKKRPDVLMIAREAYDNLGLAVGKAENIKSCLCTNRRGSQRSGRLTWSGARSGIYVTVLVVVEAQAKVRFRTVRNTTEIEIAERRTVINIWTYNLTLSPAFVLNSILAPP